MSRAAQSISVLGTCLAGHAAALVLALLCAGCGVFSPRPVEEPVDVPEDPFHLASILDNTSATFTKKDPRDIIQTGFMYQQVGSVQWDRDNLLARRKDIMSAYPKVCVAWEKNPHQSDQSPDDDNKTLYRLYSVWLQGCDAPGVADYKGESVFKVRRSPSSGWAINEWIDSPTRFAGLPATQVQKSVFSPDQNP